MQIPPRRSDSESMALRPHLLSTEGEHPLGPAHLEHLSQVVEDFLKRLGSAQIEQNPALRTNNPNHAPPSIKEGGCGE